MNAIIALCHFCEVHGPSVIFCTQVNHEFTDIPVNNKEDVSCKSCLSLGPYVALLSKDELTNFISTQNCIVDESLKLLKNACIRSLSCEVSESKEGGLMYFGDSVNGHVVSLTFQLADSQSRGFRRWFALVVLSKDKILLLNVSPFLSEHLQTISKTLQDDAKSVFDKEKTQKDNAQTFQTGLPQLKSLSQLTNKPHIFAYLHSYFTWMLKSGGSYYEEDPLRIIPEPESFEDIEEEFTVINLNEQKDDDDKVPIKMSLQNVKDILCPKVFKSLTYCVLTGIQVIMRGPSEKTLPILNSLRILFPSVHRPPKVMRSKSYVPAKLAPLLAIGIDIAAPQPCKNVFRIDVVDNAYVMKWTGVLPDKCPTLHVTIHRAIENPRLSDKALLNHIISVVEEYQNNAMAIKAGLLANTKEEIKPLYEVLGIQPIDKPVIDFWCERYDLQK